MIKTKKDRKQSVEEKKYFRNSERSRLRDRVRERDERQRWRRRRYYRLVGEVFIFAKVLRGRMDRVNGKGNDGHQDGHVIATTCTQLESFLSAVECFSTSSKCPIYVFHFIFTFPFCFCAQAHSNSYSFPSRAARQFAFVALKSTLFSRVHATL